MNGGIVILVGLFALSLTVGSNAEGETTSAPNSDAVGPAKPSLWGTIFGLNKLEHDEVPSGQNRGGGSFKCYNYNCGEKPLPPLVKLCTESTKTLEPCPSNKCVSAKAKGTGRVQGQDIEIDFLFGACVPQRFEDTTKPDGCEDGDQDSKGAEELKEKLGFVGSLHECLCSTGLCNGDDVKNVPEARENQNNVNGPTSLGGVNFPLPAATLAVVVMSLMS